MASLRKTVWLILGASCETWPDPPQGGASGQDRRSWTLQAESRARAPATGGVNTALIVCSFLSALAPPPSLPPSLQLVDTPSLPPSSPALLCAQLTPFGSTCSGARTSEGQEMEGGRFTSIGNSPAGRVCVRERERDAEKQKQRERERDAEKQKQRERRRETETERMREREREREERETHTHTCADTQTHTHKRTRTYTHLLSPPSTPLSLFNASRRSPSPRPSACPAFPARGPVACKAAVLAASFLSAARASNTSWRTCMKSRSRALVVTLSRAVPF